MKPGNLRRQGAKSGGDYRKMRLMTKLAAPSVDGVFLIAGVFGNTIFSEEMK